jgi:hypothetical protein
VPDECRFRELPRAVKGEGASLATIQQRSHGCSFFELVPETASQTSLIRVLLCIVLLKRSIAIEGLVLMVERL